MGGDLDSRPAGNVEGRLQPIRGLPLEIVGRNTEQDFGASVRINRLEFHVFSTHMHVRKEGKDIRIFIECVAAFDFVAVRICRDPKIVVRHPARLDLPRGRFL